MCKKKHYTIIELPSGNSFKKTSIEEIVEFNNWYVSIIPERLKNLESFINKHLNWKANFQLSSIQPLCKWYYSTLVNDPSNKKLKSDLNVSLALDISMYFGETLIKRVPGLRWSYQINDKKFDDYGKPVVVGDNKLPFCSSQILLTYLQGFEKNTDKDRLNEIFKFWFKQFSN